MYNINGIGNRIARWRKLSGYTQEELAERLNITAQAVSKWENELSFPEITLLPEIARVLNTSMDRLFGNESVQQNADTSSITFPEYQGHLKLVQVYNEIACYSNKEVDLTTETSVVFANGSTADLSKLEILNKGTGEIIFVSDEGQLVHAMNEAGKSEHSESFSQISSLDISVASGSYSVVRSKDNKTHVKVTGTPSFISNLEIEKNDNTLIVKYKNQNNSTNTYANNRLEIAFGQDHGEQLNATINGSGGAKIEIPFTVGRAQVNGSGDISLNELGSLECQINGSGDITCKKSGPVEVSICGSGDVSVGSVSESLKAKIVGSGDVTLGLGTVDRFIVDVSGSGDIDARKITTRCAKLRITGSGDIVIGRVLEESIEKHSKNGCIKVLQRG